MSAVITEVREKLETLKEACTKETNDLRQQLASAELELKQVVAALAAIDKKPSRAKRSPSSRRPCATKDEVLEITREILEANGPVPEEDLKAFVTDQLRAKGKSLSMFAAIFKKCLSDPSIASLLGSDDPYAIQGANGNDA